MKLKKFLAGVCTGALALSLAIPAFATTPAALTNPTATNFTGDTGSGLTVSVSVKKATTPHLYVNPYGMSYTPADIDIAAAGGDSAIKIEEVATSAGFFSDTALIQNKSESKFSVKVTMTTTSKGNVAVVAKEPTAAPTANTMFGHFEIAAATAATGSDGTVTVTPNWTSPNKIVIPAVAKATGASGSYTNTVGTSTTKNTGYILPAATSSVDPVTQATVLTPGYAAFRLTGKSYVGTAANNVWMDEDLVDVAVAFTFMPEATYYAITENDATGGDGSGTYTVSESYAAAGETVTVKTALGTNTGAAPTITGADGNTVTPTTVTANAEFTFVMPAQAVTIDVAFS